MVIIKRDGRKILFYRTGEDDWFLGVRVSSVDEFVKTHNRLHSYIWFSSDLEDQFLAICEDIKNAVDGSRSSNSFISQPRCIIDLLHWLVNYSHIAMRPFRHFIPFNHTRTF